MESNNSDSGFGMLGGSGMENIAEALKGRVVKGVRRRLDELGLPWRIEIDFEDGGYFVVECYKPTGTFVGDFVVLEAKPQNNKLSERAEENAALESAPAWRVPLKRLVRRIGSCWKATIVTQDTEDANEWLKCGWYLESLETKRRQHSLREFEEYNVYLLKPRSRIIRFVTESINKGLFKLAFAINAFARRCFEAATIFLSTIRRKTPTIVAPTLDSARDRKTITSKLSLRIIELAKAEGLTIEEWGKRHRFQGIPGYESKRYRTYPDKPQAFEQETNPEVQNLCSRGIHLPTCPHRSQK